jgi:hypothetical protein
LILLELRSLLERFEPLGLDAQPIESMTVEPMTVEPMTVEPVKSALMLVPLTEL